MEEEFEREKEGPGFMHGFLSALLKWKWLVIGVTLGLALVVFIGLQFIVNPLIYDYQYNFYIYYPNSDAGVYPDGTKFEHKDLISAENLELAKASDARFKNLDLVNMQKKGDIYIKNTREAVKIDGMESTNDDPNANIAYTLSYYTISIKATYFKEKEDAEAFMRKLAEYPLTYVRQVVNQRNYDVYLENYNAPTNLKYSELLSALNAQSDYTLHLYDTLIGYYGGDYYVNGNTLRYWRAQADHAYTSALRNILQTELDYNSYVYKESTESVLNTIYTIQRNVERDEQVYQELRNERDAVKQLYEELGNSGSSSIYPTVELPYEAEIKQYETTLAAQRQQLDILCRSICYTYNPTTGEVAPLTGSAQTAAKAEIERKTAAFEVELEGVYDRLAAASETAKEVNVAVYETESRLQNTTAGLTIDGDKNVLLFTAVAGLGGLVLSWLLAYIIEYMKSNAPVVKATQQAAPALKEVAPTDTDEE